MSVLHYYFPPSSPSGPSDVETDICVYGNSAGAVTAAVQAARSGYRCLLAINSAWIGGLTTSGLGNTDIGQGATIGGMAREFYRRVGRHYGAEEEWCFEPHVAEEVLWAMLDEAGVQPLLRQFPCLVHQSERRIVSVEFESGLRVRARQFIDASYEGDLLALAGVTCTWGREGNAAYGEIANGFQIRETHQFEAPISPFIVEGDPSSGLLPGINSGPAIPSGTGDRRIQAYNFRMCLTQASDRIPFPKPVGYEPLQYELLARYFAQGWRQLFHKFDPIRGEKTDTNNHGAVSTDFIGGSERFPVASYQEREEIFQKHVVYQQGLMWFLSHDERVPADLRGEMGRWGLPANEFQDTGGWPRQLYIRECRRLVSEWIVTEHDCRGYRTADDPVGLGSYAMDSHNCQRLVQDERVLNEGDVQIQIPAPYPVSYQAIVPRRDECSNLLVPVCISASHIAYGSVRMEPVFMILGQSAALAAGLALEMGLNAVQDLPYAALRGWLDKFGQQLKSPSRPEGKFTQPWRQ
ncbi:MAG: FAD-dependent oxidoreductase [Verrucomicrobiota bacterium]